MTLSRWFWHKTAAFFTEQCTSPSPFSMFEVTQNDLNCSLKNYGFLCDTIFSSRVRMRTNHLATKCNYNARLLNIEILLVCRECLKKAWCGHWSLSQYWIGSLWGETCCSVIDGKCGKICRVGLYAELFYATIPTLFLCFLLICYHYTFLMVFILVVSIDLVALCVLPTVLYTYIRPENIIADDNQVKKLT